MVARHRRTDPVCVKFSGAGTMRFIGGWRMKSPRRWLYDRARGRSCHICMSKRGFGAYRRDRFYADMVHMLAQLNELER